METALEPALFGTEEYLLVPDRLLLTEGVAVDHAVVVSGGRFRDIGPKDAVAARNRALHPLPLPGKLLMPGFVDAHHHLTQTFGKALAFGEPSEIFRRVWIPLEGALDYGTGLSGGQGGGARIASRRLYHCRRRRNARSRRPRRDRARRRREAGLRTVLGLICNDVAPDADRAAIRRSAEKHLAEWSADPLVRPSLAISIPEAASDGMLCDISRMAAEAGAIFQTHVNEHLAAVERSLVDRGRRPLEHLFDLGALGPHVLVAHSTLVTPARADDVARYRHGGGLQPRRLAMEGQRRRAGRHDEEPRHPLRHRHRRHAQRRLPADGRGRGDAARRFRSGNGRLVLRSRLDLARARDRCRRGCRRPRRGHWPHRGRQCGRLPAGRHRHAGIQPLLGPGLGTGASWQPRPDRRRSSSRERSGCGRAGPPTGTAAR